MKNWNLAEACGSRNHSESSNRPCLCGVADSRTSPIITEYYCTRGGGIQNSTTLPKPHKQRRCSLAGRSNVGLMEPGQNAAHTLTHLSALVFLSEPTLDDLVPGDMLRMLRDEIPKSFNRADKQLRRDSRTYGSTQNGTRPTK